MKTRDLTEMALRNLREAVLRNSLTTLGIAVGVASLVAMVSLGVGLQQLATKRLSRSGLFDTVMVASRANLRVFGPNSVPSRQGPAAPLDDDARHSFEKLPGVVEVYPQIRFMTEVRYENNPFPAMVAGVPDSARDNGAFEGINGTFFSGPTADEAILQIEFARDLSPQPASLIGKDIVLRYAERKSLAADSQSTASPSPADAGSGEGFSITPREKKLRVAGIVETEPAAGFGGIGNGRVLIPQAVAETLRAAQANDLRDVLRGSTSKSSYTSLTVRAASPSKVAAIEKSIKDMGFAAFSLLDATKNLTLIFTIFDSLLAIFGSLALAVATLGIINTLVMAILERRREIGVLKALGAADGDVKRLFFAEAGVMGLLGGIFGVGFGWMIGRAVTIGTNFYLKRQNLPATDIFSVPWWLAILAIVFAVLVSLAAGLYPASRAARLNPVEALRYE
jgi:putative ABC transport system permease protein